MRTPALLAAVAAAALLGFTGGQLMATPPPALAAEIAPEQPTPEAPQPWRPLLDAALAEADPEPLRAAALVAVSEAGSVAGVVAGLERLGPVATDADIPLLLEIVEEGVQPMRVAALNALADQGSEEAVYTLMQIMDEADPTRSYEAVHALGRAASPLAWDLLTARLAADATAGNAAHAVAAYGTPEASRALIRAFDGSGSGAAWGIAQALATLDTVRLPRAREALYKALYRGDRVHRDAATAALAQARDPGIYDALVARSGVGDVSQRTAAIQALGQLGDPRAAAALEQLARRGSPQVRGTAVYSLAQIPEREADRALVRLLEDGPRDAATAAASALRDLDRDGALDALLRACETRGPDIRNAAEQRLFSGPWLETPPEAVMALARARVLRGSGYYWANPAYDLLERYGDESDREAMAAAVFEGSIDQRVEAISALQDHHKLLPDEALAALMDDPASAVRQAAIRGMQARGGAAAELLEEKLLGLLDGAGVGWGDVENALAELGTDEATEALMARAMDGTEQESRNALFALTRAGDADLADELGEVLEDIEDPALKRRVYEALLYSGGDVEGFVYSALEEEDPALVALGTQSLGLLEGPDGQEALTELLTSEDASVRSASLNALTDLDPRAAEGALLEALEDEQVASTALSRLQNLGTPGAQAAVLAIAAGDEDVNLRTQAMYGLSWDASPEAEAVLVESLHDSDDTVRSAAVSALSSAGTSRASAALLALVEDGDPDDPLVSQAAMSLRQLGGQLARDNADTLEAFLGEHEPSDTGLFYWGIIE